MAELDGRWVTMNGARVFISSKGDVIMGLGKSYHLKELNHEQIVDLLEKHLDDYADSFSSTSKRGDLIMAILGDELGANQLPELITEEELAEEVKNGGVELWRGFGPDGEEYVEQFKTGELYYGKGLYGGGTYSTVDKEVAYMYTGYQYDEKSLAHMVLKRDARVIDYEDVAEDLLKDTTRDSLLSISDNKHIGVSGFDLYRFVRSISHDAGCTSLVNGYDAIRVPNTNTQEDSFYVVLNRGAVKVVR